MLPPQSKIGIVPRTFLTTRFKFESSGARFNNQAATPNGNDDSKAVDACWLTLVEKGNGFPLCILPLPEGLKSMAAKRCKSVLSACRSGVAFLFDEASSRREAQRLPFALALLEETTVDGLVSAQRQFCCSRGKRSLLAFC
jgi:hypothetical protein